MVAASWEIPGMGVGPRQPHSRARSPGGLAITPAPRAASSRNTWRHKAQPLRSLKQEPDTARRRWPDAAPSDRVAYRARRARVPRRDRPARGRKPGRGAAPGPDPAVADPAVPAAGRRLREHPRAGGALVPAAGGAHRPPLTAVDAPLGADGPAGERLRGPAGAGALRAAPGRQPRRPDPRAGPAAGPQSRPGGGRGDPA